MKKLFSLLFVALLALSAWGKVVTINFVGMYDANTTLTTVETNEGVTLTFSKAGGSTAPAYNANSKEVRMYKNSTMTVTADEGYTITKIDFTFSQSMWQQSPSSANVGTVGSDGNWTGEANSVIFTNNYEQNTQIRFTKMEVTIMDPASDELVAPEFHPADGTHFTGSLAVTITCATPNAEIQYYEVDPETGLIDWNTYKYYTGEFYVNETKTFAAMASKGDDYTDFVYATYTKDLPTCADPVFTPASGTTFEDDLAIRIDCETEGATITYTVNDDIYEDEAPIFITLTETSTVTAIASKDGYNDSEEVTATYTKVEPATGTCITFNCETDKGTGTASQAPWTVEKDGVTVACTKGWVDDNSYRIYQNETLTFTSTVGNITRIEFDGADNSRPISNLTTPTGAFTATASEGTWIGDASEVVFTAGAQTRASEFRVYVNGEVVPVITVAEPVIAPANNTTFSDQLTVTITCETQGATIYYGFDNETFNEYTAPFAINDACTVYAYAQIDTVKSATVQAKYFKGTEVNNLAEAKALNNNDKFFYNGEATVTYQWKNENNQYISTWIKDATGSGLIYGKQVPELTQGDVLNEGWDATKTVYNGIPEFTYPNNVEASGDVVEVTPTEYATLTTDNVNEYVILKDQNIYADGEKNFHNADNLAIYNQFGVTLPTFEDNKLYDVVGIATIYNNAPELYIISATEVGTVNIVAKPTLPEDADFTESITIEITNNEDGATIMYSTDNGETWNEYTTPLTFTETTTLQAKAVKDGVESLVVTATYTKVDPIIEATYALVTDDADLADGDQIILVSNNVAGDAYALGAIRTNNFSAVGVTIDEDMTITTGIANVITLEANGDNWNFKTEDGYLYAASSEKNWMMLEDEADANADAAITITADTTTIVFQGENTRNVMRFNLNVQNEVPNPLFSCYAPTSSVKNPVYIYKVVATQTWELGDVNHSGGVDIEDVTTLINAVLGNPSAEYYPEQANCNGEGGVDIEDVTALIGRVLNGNW